MFFVQLSFYKFLQIIFKYNNIFTWHKWATILVCTTSALLIRQGGSEMKRCSGLFTCSTTALAVYVERAAGVIVNGFLQRPSRSFILRQREELVSCRKDICSSIKAWNEYKIADPQLGGNRAVALPLSFSKTYLVVGHNNNLQSVSPHANTSAGCGLEKSNLSINRNDIDI